MLCGKGHLGVEFHKAHFREGCVILSRSKMLLVGVPVPRADLPERGRWVAGKEEGVPRDGLPCTRNTESSSEPPKTRSDQLSFQNGHWTSHIFACHAAWVARTDNWTIAWLVTVFDYYIQHAPDSKCLGNLLDWLKFQFLFLLSTKSHQRNK